MNYFPAFIGQEPIKEFLQTEIRDSQRYNRSLEHVLLSGPPGMGKSKLAKSLADATSSTLVSYVADKSWSANRVSSELLRLDITGYDSSGRRGANGQKYVIFMDECHLLPSYEPWYTILQDCEIYHNGRVSWLPDLTFVGATTNPALPKPFLDRIALQFRLEPYTIDDLSQIIQQEHKNIDSHVADNIAQRSRQTARIALRYADFYIRHGGLSFFDKLGIDSQGLTPLDRSYLKALAQYDRPLSLDTVSALLCEDKRALAEVVEPYLKALGLIVITPKGRMLVSSDVISRNGRGNKPKLEASSDSLDRFLELTEV